MIMKKVNLLISAFTCLLLFNCETESFETTAQTGDPNFRVYEHTNKDGSSAARASYDEPCTVVNLIAGQNHIAGTVSIDSDGQNLILIYTTNADWTIDLTHMSIGDCNEQWVPTTGSGNPKVGHFEHTEPHSTGTNEVIYLISLDALTENYCFAAHAEVQGPTGGETAWAEGVEFDGNSWAMYVEALLSDCDIDGQANDSTGEGDGTTGEGDGTADDGGVR